MCLMHRSPFSQVPTVKWKASVVIPGRLGGGIPALPRHCCSLSLTFALINMPTQCPRVYLEENMHLKPPNYLPVSLVPLSFPWHIGTMGRFALISGRIHSVNLSQPNLNFSKKGCKDIGSGNSQRDKNKISSQKSHFHKLPG